MSGVDQNEVEWIHGCADYVYHGFFGSVTGLPEP